MKKKLFTICVFSIALWSFTTDSTCALTDNRVKASIIRPIIIRPPLNKLKMVCYNTSIANKSTFVDTYFEV